MRATVLAAERPELISLTPAALMKSVTEQTWTDAVQAGAAPKTTQAGAGSLVESAECGQEPSTKKRFTRDRSKNCCVLRTTNRAQKD